MLRPQRWFQFVWAILIFIALVSICAVSGMLEPEWRAGTPLPDKFNGQFWHVTGLSSEDNGDASLCIVTENPESLPVLILHGGTVTGELKKAEEPFAVGFRAYSLDAIQPENTDNGRTWTVAVSSNSDSITAFLCDAETAQRWSALLSAGMSMVCGALLVMALYALTLYLYHRTKNYLLFFSLYTFALCIWILPSVLSIPSAFFAAISYRSYDFAIAMSLLMCSRLCDIHLPAPLRWLYTNAGAVLVSVVFSCLVGLCGFSLHTLDVLRFSLYLGESIVLTRGIFYGMHDRWILLSGLLFTQAVRFSMLVFPFDSFTHPSLAVLLLRNQRICVFVFAIGCMLFTNRLFALNYHETEELSQELHRLVEERTSQLVAENQRRNHLMTNIFHDLRSPLFVIQGCLLRLRNSDDARDALQIADQKVNYVIRLTEDLFTLAKFEDHQILMDTEPFSFSDVVQRQAASANASAESSRITMTSAIMPGIMAWGDEHRMEEAVQNLITNALYYTPYGGQVSLQLESTDDTIRFSVKDTGKGIAPEDLDKIFERYYRVSGSERHESSGLGLSIAREIVRMHHGDIQVQSTVGQGSVFTITLPLWKAA